MAVEITLDASVIKPRATRHLRFVAKASRCGQCLAGIFRHHHWTLGHRSPSMERYGHGGMPRGVQRPWRRARGHLTAAVSLICRDGCFDRGSVGTSTGSEPGCGGLGSTGTSTGGSVGCSCGSVPGCGGAGGRGGACKSRAVRGFMMRLRSSPRRTFRAFVVGAERCVSGAARSPRASARFLVDAFVGAAVAPFCAAA